MTHFRKVFYIIIIISASWVQAGEVDLQKLVNDVHAKFASVSDGKNPDYIPALAVPDSKLFAVSIVTADGKVYSAGDIDHIFCDSNASIMDKIVEWIFVLD